MSLFVLNEINGDLVYQSWSQKTRIPG